MQPLSEIINPVGRLISQLEILPDLLEKSEVFFDFDKKREFELQVTSALKECIETLNDCIRTLKTKRFVTEERSKFEPPSGENHRPVDTLISELGTLDYLLERSKSHINPEKKREFELRIALALNHCIERLKNKAEDFDAEGWNDIKEEW